MVCEPDLGGSPEKPLSYPELAKSLAKVYREVQAATEAKTVDGQDPVKEPVLA